MTIITLLVELSLYLSDRFNEWQKTDSFHRQMADVDVLKYAN